MNYLSTLEYGGLFKAATTGWSCYVFCYRAKKTKSPLNLNLLMTSNSIDANLEYFLDYVRSSVHLAGGRVGPCMDWPRRRRNRAPLHEGLFWTRQGLGCLTFALNFSIVSTFASTQTRSSKLNCFRINRTTSSVAQSPATRPTR